jgi:hypothetical protein
MTLATGLILAVSQMHVCATALGQGAQTFRQYFRALGEESLNPVERVVFSLVLTNAKASPKDSHPARHGA